MMTESVASTSGATVSAKEKNIAVLFDKLKELRVEANTSDRAHVYSRIESKYQKYHFFKLL